MPGETIVSLVLTKRDIKQFYLAEMKKSILVTALVGIVLVVALDMMFHWDVVFIVIEAIIFPVMLFLIFFIRYNAAVNEFQNSRSLDKSRQYRFGREEYTVVTKDGFMTTKWRDIVRLQELRPCFVIVLSVGKYHLLPKRCFNGPEELGGFYDLVETSVDRAKLKIRKYPFGGFSPDPPAVHGTPAHAETAVPSEPAAAGGTPVFRFDVLLNERDIVTLNYWHYFTGPTGIIWTLAGILLLLVIVMIIRLELDFSSILPAILSAYFLIFMPVLIYIQSKRAFKQDAAAGRVTTYEFYDDHLVINNANGIYARNIADLHRIVSLKRAYLLFLSKHMAYIIPKRCVSDPAAFDTYIRYMKAENSRLKSYAAMKPPIIAQEPDRFCARCGAPRRSAAHVYCINCGKKYDV